MKRLSANILCVVLSLVVGFSAPLLAVSDIQMKGANEYFASNSEGRIMIKVQVWGDIPLTGVHHVPDNTTLIDLLGIAGGPNGDIEDADFTVRRKIVGKTSLKTIKYSGEEMISSLKPDAMLLNNGDIIYVESSDPSEEFSKNLNIATTVSSLITSGLVLYMLSKGND